MWIYENDPSPRSAQFRDQKWSKNFSICNMNILQGNSRKGFWKCRLSCLFHYVHYLSIPLQTNSWDDISRTLFANSPVCGSYEYGKHFLYCVCIEVTLNLTKNIKCLNNCILFLRWMIHGNFVIGIGGISSEMFLLLFTVLLSQDVDWHRPCCL